MKNLKKIVFLSMIALAAPLFAENDKKPLFTRMKDAVSSYKQSAKENPAECIKNIGKNIGLMYIATHSITLAHELGHLATAKLLFGACTLRLQIARQKSFFSSLFFVEGRCCFDSMSKYSSKALIPKHKAIAMLAAGPMAGIATSAFLAKKYKEWGYPIPAAICKLNAGINGFNMIPLKRSGMDGDRALRALRGQNWWS